VDEISRGNGAARPGLGAGTRDMAFVAGLFDLIARPAKRTLLHNFIKYVNYSNIEWETGHLSEDYVIGMATTMLEGAGLNKPDWLTEERYREHVYDLDDLLFLACDYAADAAFYILFSDKDFLFDFCKIVGNSVRQFGPSDADCFEKPGVIKRLTYLPSWLRTAIYHRDHGHCQDCTRDLTALNVPFTDLQYDHMLPLDVSGTNDPTNFQLLCKACNTSKKAKPLVKKQLVCTYWDMGP